jgi:tRNA nucleotidyltransferase (CCA-adding enzyme)
MHFIVPEEVASVSKKLRKAGFEAYLVGGCVRDLILNRDPKDWDLTTNATPEDIQAVFPESFYENTFGTVGIKTQSKDPRLSIIEVTPYRTESDYSDKRRPDFVSFGKTIEEDLARRDFTINAIAYDESKGQILDPYKGQKDIELRLLRTVGVASDRFEEDALRLLRAIRFISELEFTLDGETAAAIQLKAKNLTHISRERIRDEFVKILESKQPMLGLVISQQLGILEYISPVLTEGIGIEQNQAHSYDVFGHLLRSLQHAADKDWDLDLRIAALFHDVAKPKVRQWSLEKNDWTFHGHEVVGAKMTKHALSELKFSRERIDKITNLVRWHMFFSDPDQITLSAVRRMIQNVGKENIEDLLNLRICDRIGTGRPKEQPFRFRKYKAMVEQALRDPISVKMLKTNGEHIMKNFHVEPGPTIGYLLNTLLEEVIENPLYNETEYLDKRTKELLGIDFNELKKLGESGKVRKEALEQEEIKKILRKNKVY